MTIRQDDDGAIVLEGRCPLEDAEMLVSLLLRYPDAHVVLDRCDFAHTAIVQILMAARPAGARSTEITVFGPAGGVQAGQPDRTAAPFPAKR